MFIFIIYLNKINFRYILHELYVISTVGKNITVCDKLMVGKTFLSKIKNSSAVKKKMPNLITKYV